METDHAPPMVTAAQTSEQRYRSLVDLAPDIVFRLVAEDGSIVSLNPAFEEMTGWPRSQWIGQPFVDLLHFDDRSQAADTFRAVVSRAREQRMEARYRATTGEYRNAEIVIAPVIVADQVVGLLGVAHDVTERRRSEDALRLLAQTNLVLSSSLDCSTTLAEVAHHVVPVFADGCIIYTVQPNLSVQRRAVAHVDPDKETLLRELIEHVPIDLRAGHGMARVIREGRTLFAPEIGDAGVEWFVGGDAEYGRYLRKLDLNGCIIAPLAARGQTLGSMAFIRCGHSPRYQETDVRLAEEVAVRTALALDNTRLYQDAQEAIRARDVVFASVSHDLKGPLAIIKGYAQLIQATLEEHRAVTPEDIRGWASKIDLVTSKMVGQIEELLDVAALQMGQSLQLKRQRLDLVRLAQRVAAEHQHLTTHHQIQVTAEPPQVVGEWDADRIERVLGNLLSNAIKYSPMGGPIDVRVAVEESTGPGWAVVAVQDRGIGISEEDLPHVFERFRRATTVAEQINGAGIGLATCLQVVVQHGGTINVASHEGQGSTFTVRLPLS